MYKLLRGKKGFTLIELMIVVAIIGILAAIAIPNFLTFRLKAKTSESKSNLGAIKTLEEAYKAEADTYDCTGTGSIAIYPRATGALTDAKATWTSSATAFSALGFQPAGDVYYSYSVSAAAANTFQADAYGDLDSDDAVAQYYINQTGSITQNTAKSVY